MKRAMKISIGIAGAALLASLVVTQVMCHIVPTPSESPGDDEGQRPASVVTATAATTVSAGRTSVRVCIVMVVHKKYGLLAHVFGKKDTTIADNPYDAGKSWWDNPMVIFQDVAFPGTGPTAGADAATIAGHGTSSNVSVEMILVPHADVTLRTLVKSDCIKGTLTATISTSSAYYDGQWTEVASAQDKPLVFELDSCDASKQMRPAGTETRMVPPFTFGRYTRDHQKWDASSTWPTNAKSGDWRCTIKVKDAKLAITGYEYAAGEKGGKK